MEELWKKANWRVTHLQVWNSKRVSTTPGLEGQKEEVFLGPRKDWSHQIEARPTVGLCGERWRHSKYGCCWRHYPRLRGGEIPWLFPSSRPPGSHHCLPLVDLCRKLVDWQPVGIGLPVITKQKEGKEWFWGQRNPGPTLGSWGYV